ncbi:MAG TPA: hypothetical protein VMI09_09570 [Candidatus Binataceae bacterium]|nr:hypothetical protein [Candidatus Binataceae bacterium]
MTARTERPKVLTKAFGPAVICLLALFPCAAAMAGGTNGILFEADDTSGRIATYRPTGRDGNNPFFQQLGSNGRTCNTCHRASDGWSITPAHIHERFAETLGSDPLFRPIDGATCPTDDISSVAAMRTAYALLLNRGLIRIPLSLPASAEFSITDMIDPYGCSQLDSQGSGVISVYRRPLPVTNLVFLTSITWDGREPDLRTQALNAALQHERPKTSPSEDQLDQIVGFETANYTAQVFDRAAGSLRAWGATAGPVAVSDQQFLVGINDPFGGNPTGALFDPDVFVLYEPWLQAPHTALTPARQAVIRGERVFNEKLITISGVAGLNDALGLQRIAGACSFCHDTPGVGNHSTDLPLDTGVSELGTRGLPRFSLSCHSGPLAGASFALTDPGRAAITGQCADIGKFKVPTLRGLAARPPYFHDGSANTLMDVVNFYDHRFAIGLTLQQKRDLVAFLKTL